jgi:activator of HSP90 ATPase
MGERTITGYATSALKEKLRGLNLGSGLFVEDNLSSWVSGEVSIGDRKGKSYPIYSLEVEVPFSGTVNGALVKGSVHLPDLSLEMLDDLEVDLDVAEGSAADSVKEAAAEKVREAVRNWASCGARYVRTSHTMRFRSSYGARSKSGFTSAASSGGTLLISCAHSLSNCRSEGVHASY